VPAFSGQTEQLGIVLSLQSRAWRSYIVLLAYGFFAHCTQKNTLGKSTLARKLFDALGGSRNVTYLVHDSYYRDQSHKSLSERAETNFDHPDALETDLLVEHIRALKRGSVVEVPTYDFKTHTRICKTKAVELHGPRPILLVEGILILCFPELVKEMDLKVFVVSG
jgi:uridine kinase